MENIGDISTIPIMEKQPVILGNQNTGTMSGTTPALYVLVKQSTGKPDQGTLLSNQDNSSLLSSAAKPVKPKAKTYLPADCASGNITVMLDNNNMWNEFYHRSTEMILTKQGRRMFPYCRYWISGLESNLKYILVMDISPIDNFRYKWNGHSWEPSGKAEPHVLGRVFIHPESPSTGHYWMHQPVSFYKLKLTNNTLDQEGHIILHSMHRYLPRLHLVPAEKATEVIQLNGPDVQTFTFPQTEFFAVTAYQNIQITQLKIDYNPFAKGFREDGLSSRLQRDVKQNGSSEHEGNSVTSSPTNHRHPLEGNILDPSQKLDPPPSGICDPDLEKESLSPYHEFLHFAETDVHAGDDQGLKEEASESPISNPCQKLSHVTSQLTQEGGINVSVKEEPLDNYEYEPLICMEGVNVKEEETNNIAEEYSNSDGSILEQQLEKYSKIDKMDIEFHKEQQINQLGVAKAKMLKLDSGKMPVVYLESCTMTKDTVKVSALSQALMTTKNEKSPHSLDSFPAHFENKSISSPPEVEETEKITTDKMVSENITPHIPSEEDVLGISTEAYSSLNTTEIESSCDLKAPATSSPSLAKVIFDDQNINMLKTHISGKSIVGSQNVGVSGPKKRGRPRKSKLSEAGRSSKCIAKSDTTNNVSLGSGSTHLDVNPDLEDVDGMLFVSFVSKEALDIHSFDRAEEKELQNTLNNSLATCNPCTDSDGQRIQQMEKELLEDLKSFKYKQVIHPSLQEVGLKLNFVDPTMSIDLKYLGVQLPLSYSEEYASWKNEGTDSNSADTGLHFISRTGKTNDITKIKGWRGKFHNTSKNEGIILEGLLKNRSAFCSDKLDEYLENEGKLMETSIGFSPSTSSSPVVYQLPTKSTSYVRTLDSVLKKQSTASNLSSYTSKPLDLPSISKKIKDKMKNKKQAISKGKEKSPPKGTIGLSVAKKHKHKLISEEKISKSQAIDRLSQTVTEKDASMVSGTEGNLQSKQITMRQVQQQQGSRLSTLSKTQLKLLDLEDCALWDGKPRTYITEERAELSLTILLTAQASLKNKPIHKIIKKKAPPCNNDFCRLGCICSSLAVEKRQPTHCRKPDCMFGCTCLKRKVVLVKNKKIQEKPLHGKHKLYRERNQEQQTNIIAKDDQEKMKLKDKKKKTKIEYTICDTEPEKPVKNFPLWVKKDGEMDPEPIYIPTPSDVEATMSPVPDIIPTDDKPTAIEVNSMGNGVKPLRVYTPRPNPVIREEDKDPVYLYFESMMTCARVRIYERKVQEKGQQEKCPWNCEKHIEKEHDADPQPLKIEEDKDPEEKSWWFSCSAEHPSTSYVHRITPDGKNKLIEIISDCNWEEDRKEILSILSQHIRNKMPKSLKVGHFIIELESESKTWDEKNTPIYSSRVKISMPPCQNKNQNLPVVVESPNAGLSPCKRTEKLTPQKLQKQRKKGLPFYAGLSSAGKLIANTCKYDLNPSGSIQVNGKHSPQAKLILGQMGALHPASHLAAYLMGRLQPTMSDLSKTNLKIAPSNKLAVSESLPTEASPSEASKTPFSADTTSVSTARVSSQRQIAPRPLLDGVTNQLTFLNTVGGLQKKASETGSSQSLTGPQKSNTKSISSSASSTTVVTTTAITSVASLPVTISSPLQNNSPDIACTNTVEKQEINISSAMDAMEMTKPVTSMPFVQSSIPVSTSTAVIPLTVTSPTSSVSCVQPTGLSGIQKSPVSNQKQGATSPPGLPRGAEYRMGTRFILIPVQQCSSTLRPSQNMQLASGKRIVLQPLRHPGAVNLYRHPNGQIIQLVPLQQLQTSGAQSTLQPIMLRNPGSVVGIRLPGPSKLPEIAACQASAIPSVTSTTTSILSTCPSVLSEFSTAENISILSGTSSATTALLAQTPTTESSLVLPMSSNALSLSPSAETSSLLSMTSTTDIPLSPTTSSTTLASSTAAISPSLPYSVPVSPTNKSPSVFTVSPNGTNSLLPMPPSTILMSSIIEGTSAASESLVTNWTLQDMRTTAVHSALITQVTPVNSSGSVSPLGTLTLRISPSGIKNNSDQTGSQSKISCNASGVPSNINNLISLQSGSFALLQFPGQKNDPGSIAKKVAPLEIKISHKKNELSANKLKEDSICSQMAEITGSEISKLKENNLPDFHSEEITCNRNISEIIEKDAEILKLPNFSLMLQANIQSDHSYTTEKQKGEEDEALIKKTNQDKDDEHPLDKVPYPDEKCNEVAHDILPERSTQNPITESKKAEQKPLDTKAGLITEQSWWKPGKPAQPPKTLNNTEKLQTKNKPSVDPWKNEDPELPMQNMKEKCDFVAKEKDKEKVNEKAKINIGKNNTLGNEYLDSTHKDLYEKNTDFQSNFSSYEKSIQEDNQNKKVEHKISKTCGKISRPSLVVQNKINVGADELAEKLTKSTKQNTWKTKNHRKNASSLIDINWDDTEKDEKTEESANEMVDEAFGYQSEDTVNVEVLNGSESSEFEETVDIETVEEFSEKVNLARLKATAAHALLYKQLHLVRNHSNKTIKRHKQSEFPNKKVKNEEQAFANYRQTHTANERRRRKEMRGLFEKLKATLGLQAFPKVSKCFILKQALEEIQGLTDQADKLTGQKNLLLHTQDTLVRKVSALSGKTQEVVLKKLEYIYAKQKAVAAQKGKQKEQADPTKMIESTETASPSVEKDPTSVLGEVKPVVLSNQRTKPLILSRKENHVTEDLPPSITLTNANLLMTTNGQVLAFRNSLVPRQVTDLPSTLLQAKVKSEMVGNDEKEQSVENEDSFLMPRIVNVTSLATEEEINLNPDANKGPYTMLNTDSGASELSMQVLSQETSNHKCKENEDGSEKERNITGTTQDLLQEKYSFPQIVNVSSLKGSPEIFGTKLCFEELTGSQTWVKEVDGGGGDCQKSKKPSLQKLQVNKAKDPGSEMERQQVASVIHEPTMDTSSSVDIEENDDTDETLTSLLNEIAFLNQKLNDDTSDIPEISSSFSLADTESRQESNSASSSAFQFGTVDGNFKDLSMIQDNGDSITPLLLHLDDDDFPVGNRNAGEVSSESDALKIMLGSEVKGRNSNLLKINGSGKNMESSAKTRSVSPPILHMKTNLEAGTSDMSWRPMPKLAPLGLKTANHSLDSEGQSTKVMPALASVASKEKKLAQSAINPSQDAKATNTKATAVTKSN
ncbi:MAX gene-associated protein isoform X1 [Notechis scutatus]|uniref:MAX gene-associated protein n=1 Tax=Notechis scutatus TaxID=8663 RepID=A0A6J1TXS4_9SAUR|nr:MAX gene-associated protein isoform X1 [Notechis scutatus]XP_026520385.1 MAX gene-associated protein isoform X1 [Notechis scutatus]XP_026520386.1 MAX gene-associated protein isoform X1 [Notechis scutatus]